MNNSKIFYIDPNKYNSFNKEGNNTFSEIPVNIEDLSLGVNLTVIIPNRDSCGQNETYSVSYKEPSTDSTVSFFQGNGEMLTDKYATITYTDILNDDYKSTKECLGIKDITISYNSYFYPEVTINFTDVRGNSLIMPNETNYRNTVIKAKGDDELTVPTQENFFASLFTFPYPMFFLTVKGFYGLPVQFQLAVNDFRSSFNTDSGNFEATVKFIGYMYGIYTDIPMSYLIAAPYCKYGAKESNKTIWEEKDFKLNGTQMPTLLELRQQLLQSNDLTNVQIHKELMDKYTLYSNAKIKLEEVRRKYLSFKNELKNCISKENNKKCFEIDNRFLIVYESFSKIKLDIDENKFTEFITSIQEYNSEFSNVGRLPYPNDMESTLFNETFWPKADENLGENMIKRHFSDEVPHLYIEGSSSSKPSELRNFYNLFKEYPKTLGQQNIGFLEDIRKTNMYPKLKDAIYNICSNIEKRWVKEDTCIVGFFLYDAGKFHQALEKNSHDITAKIRETIEDIAKDYKGRIENHLGYELNIKNVIKILMAHMDTFMQIFGTFLSKVDSDERNASNLQINLNMTDINVNGEDSFVSPFPLFKDNSGNVVYPEGLNFNDIEETKLVSSFLDSSKFLINNTDLITLNELNNLSTSFLPTLITDYTNPYNNPYNNMSKKNMDVDISELLTVFGMRLSAFHNFGAGVPGIAHNMSNFGKAEAFNFWATHKTLNHTAINELRALEFNQKNFYNFINNISNNNPYINGKPIYSPLKRIYFDKTKYRDTKIPSYIENMNFTDNDDETYYQLEKYSYNVSSFKTYIDDVEKIEDIVKSDYRIKSLPKVNKIIKNYDYIKKWNNNILNLSYTDKNDLSFKDSLVLNKKASGFSQTNQVLKRFYVNENTGETNEMSINLNDIIEQDIDDFEIKRCDLGNDEGQSIFSHPLYLYQKNDNNGLYIRALLFLMSFQDKYPTEEFFKKIVVGKNIFEAPYLLLLYLGGMIWGKKNKGRIEYDNNFAIAPPSSYEANSVKFPFLELSNARISQAKDSFEKSQNKKIYNYTTKRVTISNKKDLSVQPCTFLFMEYVSRLTQDEDCLGLEKMFVEWVNNKVDGFSAINDFYNFKLFDKDFEWYTLLEISNLFKKNSSMVPLSYITSEDYMVHPITDFPNKEEYLRAYPNKIGIVEMLNILTTNRFSEQFDGIDCSDGIQLILKKNTKGYNILKSLYKERCLVSLPTQGITLRSPFGNDSKYYNEYKSYINTAYDFKEETLNDAFDSFKQSLLNYYKTNNEEEQEEFDNKRTSLKLSMYLTFKNLYDKWISGDSLDKWDINNPNGEFKRFNYIDSFYNDIGETLQLNGKQIINLIDIILGKNTTEGNANIDLSLYSFISLLCQKNNMLFLALPVFNGNIEMVDKAYKDMFTPLSYLDSSNVNKCYGPSYICLYPHKPSEHLELNNRYKNDGFDIPLDPYISGEDMSGTASPLNELLPNDLNYTEGSYMIPSFSVDFAQQNQNLFKNISVNMDNPQVTEYSMAAQFNIANMTSENTKTLNFEGQDLYKIYSNHSYTCTVEMMGCAQIQPLMYFQLNNIPMFHGAYMVIKVEHILQPGNMITKFTGVRLNKNKIPMVKNVSNLSDILDAIKNGTAIGVLDKPNTQIGHSYVPNQIERVPSSEVDELDDSYKYETYIEQFKNVVSIDNITSFNNKKDSFNTMNKYLRKNIFEITDSFVKYDTSLKGYGIKITSMTRNKKSGGKKSDHSIKPLLTVVNPKRKSLGLENKGCAIDIIGYNALNKKVDKKQMSIDLFNFIATNYTDDIRQLIWESKGVNETSNSEISNCIHYATYGKGNNDKCEIFQAYGPKYNKVVAKYDPKNDEIPNNISPEFILVMNNIIETNADFNIKNFINFVNIKGFSKDMIKQWAKKISEKELG